MKSRAEMNNTLFELCLYKNFKEIRGLLFSGKADVNYSSESRESCYFPPLHHCVQSSNTEISEFLIMCGADVNARDKSGGTPLTQDIPYSSIELLIRQRADINAKNRSGWTGLHYAALGRRQEAVEMLLERKADCTLITLSGKTPADCAINQGLKDLFNEAIKEQNLSKTGPK